ncbi:MAG TPA: hypothetical protein VMT20_20365 [Terriglobia bacterium]|nr:hypothetical protein [Terriglobia bacterium]
MEGIASVISLMHERDLQSYQQIDWGGLTFTAFLEPEGLTVCHLPAGTQDEFFAARQMPTGGQSTTR